MRTKILFFFVLTVLLMACTANSINTPEPTEKQDSISVEQLDSIFQDCYTIQIRGIEEENIVVGQIINMPKDAPFTGFIGYCLILFDKADLSNQDISQYDEIDIMLLSVRETPVIGYTTGDIKYYFCKVKPCE